MSRAEIEDRAARFIMRRDEPGWSEADAADLKAWLDESMAHKAAYWRLAHGWEQADRIAALGRQGVEPEARRSSLRRSILVAIAAMSVGGLMISLPLIQSTKVNRPAAAVEQAYATPLGGRRTVALSDGSSVELNTATRLRASIAEGRREVWLDRGEAFFKVAHDATHPFVVHAGDRRIIVLGTSFSVRVDGGQVSVSVVEGKVRVDPAQPPTAPSTAVTPTLTRGELAITRGAETLIAANALQRVDRGLAWRQGMLSFDQSTLADVAAEFNRYNVRKIVVDDPAAASIRIGGTFKSSNSAAFLRLLQSAYGLRVRDDGEKIIVSS